MSEQRRIRERINSYLDAAEESHNQGNDKQATNFYHLAIIHGETPDDVVKFMDSRGILQSEDEDLVAKYTNPQFTQAEILQLARIAYKKEDYRGAAILYKQLDWDNVQPSSPNANKYRQEFYRSLYKDGQYKELLDRSEQFISRGFKEPFDYRSQADGLMLMSAPKDPAAKDKIADYLEAITLYKRIIEGQEKLVNGLAPAEKRNTYEFISDCYYRQATVYALLDKEPSLVGSPARKDYHNERLKIVAKSKEYDDYAKGKAVPEVKRAPAASVAPLPTSSQPTAVAGSAPVSSSSSSPASPSTPSSSTATRSAAATPDKAKDSKAPHRAPSASNWDKTVVFFRSLTSHKKETLSQGKEVTKQKEVTEPVVSSVTPPGEYNPQDNEPAPDASKGSQRPTGPGK